MRDVIRVIDSSLHATVPFPVFLTRNSYPRSEQERRRLSDYLLLHKVFNTKRNLKSKIKKKFIFVSQRNSEIKKII